MALLCVVADEKESEKDESDLLAAVLYKISVGVALQVREVGVALRFWLYSENQDIPAVLASRVLSRLPNFDASPHAM